MESLYPSHIPINQLRFQRRSGGKKKHVSMSSSAPLLNNEIRINESDDRYDNSRATPFVSNTSNMTTNLILDSRKLINWTSLNKVYSIISEYGGPSCILPTNSYFVLGTIKGALLIFNYKEFLQVILLPQTRKEIVSSTQRQNSFMNRFVTSLHSKVVNIVMSDDGTYIAAGYESGDVYLWNLNYFTDIYSTDSHSGSNYSNSNITGGFERTVKPIPAILHITEHQGKEITGIDFMQNRHTGLIVSDVNGNVLYHNGHRTGFWGMTYNVQRILQVAPNEIILHTKLKGDKLAILTNKNFGILSIQGNNFSGKMHTKDTVDSNDIVPQNSLTWLNNNLAYSIKNRVIVYYEIIPSNGTRKLIWNCEELILSIQWMSQNLLGVLTVSHQLLIVKPSENFHIVMSIDLLPHDLLIPPNKHFKWYRNKLFLLTNYSFKIGRFVSWSSLLLKRVQSGDYIGSLSLLNQFVSKNFPIPTFLHLSINHEVRKSQLKDPFNNLVFAALRFLLNNNKVDSIKSLISMAIQLRIEWFPKESQQVISEFLDIIWETILQQQQDITVHFQEVFLDTINELIENNIIKSLSPTLFQALLQKFPNSIKTLIFSLDKSSWDCDLLIRLCQEQRNLDMLLFIWNVSFNDYLSPFIELLKWIRDGNLIQSYIFGNVEMSSQSNFNPGIIYDYIESCYKGLQYPTSLIIEDKIKIYQNRQNMTYILFNGVDITWPLTGEKKLKTIKNSSGACVGNDDEPSFPYFKLLMKFNPKRFYDMLTEILSDSFFGEFDDEKELNEYANKKIVQSQFSLKITKQNVLDILFNVIEEEKSLQDESSRYYTIVYVVHYLKQHLQDLHTNKTDLDIIMNMICDFPKTLGVGQESIEDLIIDMINMHEPTDPHHLIAQLKARNFQKVLYYFYRKNHKYLESIKLLLDKENRNFLGSFDLPALIEDACKNMRRNSTDFINMKSLIKENFEIIVELVSIKDVVDIMQNIDPTLHALIQTISVPDTLKLDYLEFYFTSGIDIKYQNAELKKYYIILSCKLRKEQDLTKWVREKGLSVLDDSYLLEELQKLNNYDALYVIYHHMGKISEELICIIKCVDKLFQEKGELKVNSLNSYIMAGIDSILSMKGSKVKYWIIFISAVMKEFSQNKKKINNNPECNKILNKLFFQMIAIERKNNDNLYEIMTGILNKGDIMMAKTKNLGELFTQIFTSFRLEEAISKTLLKIIQESSSGMVNKYRMKLREGWTIHNSECEICGKTLWGAGLNPDIFLQWEYKQRALNSTVEQTSNEIIIVFKCCHGFHKKCLGNLGQKDGTYQCLLCLADDK